MSSFFRVLVGEYAAKLRIPPLFVSRFSCLTPKAVTLFCSSQRSWTVDIEEEDNKELYFKRGWNTFVEDNALETGEFIVFKFDGNSTFKAKIYGKSYLRKNKSSISVSSFFKILINAENTTKLRIPLLFVARYSTLVPRRLTFIRASSNRSWKVDIEEEDDKRFYYKSGWSTFVEDNAVEIAQLLVFKFVGDSTFKVKIFGNSACEKELENLPCVNQNYCIQHHIKQTATQDHQENQKEERDPNPIDDVDGQKSKIDDVDGQKSKIDDVDGQKSKIDDVDGQKSKINDLDGQKSKPNVETMMETVDVVIDDDGGGSGDSNQETEAPQEEVEEQSDEPIVIEPDPSHSPMKKRTGSREYEGPMIKASCKRLKLDSKKNPSFKIFLKPAYAEKGVMCVPTEFFQKHMMNKRQEVEIETEKGVWTVRLLPHMKRTRTFARLSKGWSDFAKAHCFKTGETLVFKMIRKGDRPKFIVDRQ